jgi:hypothetical protein
MGERKGTGNIVSVGMMRLTDGDMTSRNEITAIRARFTK